METADPVHPGGKHGLGQGTWGFGVGIGDYPLGFWGQEQKQ